MREGQSLDIDWLIPQLKQFSLFFGSRRSLFPSNEEYARERLADMMQSHFFRVAEQDGAPVGFIAGYVTPHPFNPEIWTLAETFWWVDPIHRQGRAGLLLLNAFVEWGRDHVDLLTFALEAHSPVNPRTLEKRGLQLQEHNFMLEVE